MPDKLLTGSEVSPPQKPDGVADDGTAKQQYGAMLRIDIYALQAVVSRGGNERRDRQLPPLQVAFQTFSDSAPAGGNVDSCRGPCYRPELAVDQVAPLGTPATGEIHKVSQRGPWARRGLRFPDRWGQYERTECQRVEACEHGS